MTARSERWRKEKEEKEEERRGKRGRPGARWFAPVGWWDDPNIDNLIPVPFFGEVPFLGSLLAESGVAGLLGSC